MSRFSDKFKRREKRTRYNVKKLAYGRKRLSVFRSERHIYAQLIDDELGVTLCTASTLEKDFSGRAEKTSGISAASVVGELIAKKVLNLGIKEVVFDRGGYAYHGRVKALADNARNNGLLF